MQKFAPPACVLRDKCIMTKKLPNHGMWVERKGWRAGRFRRNRDISQPSIGAIGMFVTGNVGSAMSSVMD